MKFTEAQRGLLLSKMADDVVASILERRTSWVTKARAALAEQAAADLAAWIELGKERSIPPEQLGQEMCRCVLVPIPEPQQIDLEELIAAAEPVERMGAPADLTGKQLATWLYDNTEATFQQIAEVSGLDLEEVQTIADGDDPEPQWTTVILPTDRDLSSFEDAPAEHGADALAYGALHFITETVPVHPGQVIRPFDPVGLVDGAAIAVFDPPFTTPETWRREYLCDWSTVAPLEPIVESAAPQPDGSVSLMVSGGRNMGKTRAAELAVNVALKAAPDGDVLAKVGVFVDAATAKSKGGRPRLTPAPVQIAEIPTRVLRYCRWFITAKWRVVDVAFLFDLEERDLRAALHLY